MHGRCDDSVNTAGWSRAAAGHVERRRGRSVGRAVQIVLPLLLALVVVGRPTVAQTGASGTPTGGIDAACLPAAPATPAGGGIAEKASAVDAALIEAARRGDADEVERLLAAGARVDATDATGQTALIAAAWRNDLPIACLLVAAGADVNAKDDTEQSAYLIATSEGYLELLRLTLAAGADVRSLDSFRGTGLIRAAERGHVAVVAELLETEVAVDHVNRLGLTALLEAIVFGDGGPRHTEVVRRLLAAGADPNLADGAGVTPLAHAQRLGFDAIAALLIEAGGR